MDGVTGSDGVVNMIGTMMNACEIYGAGKIGTSAAARVGVWKRAYLGEGFRK